VVVSLTLPCHKRLEDLLVTLPILEEAARVSPPVEIILVDYANPEPLPVETAGDIYVVRYTGRDHYHMAHARNVGIQAATGDVVVITSSDIHLTAEFIDIVRRGFEDNPKAGWLRPDTFEFVGVVAVRRDELVAAGGYDERFEFYGGEDRELHERLERRGVPWASYPADGLIEMARTPNAVKVRGYRLPLTKTDMLERGSAIRLGNQATGLLVANDGQEWGAL